MKPMNRITERLIEIIAEIKNDPNAAYNLRENGLCTALHSNQSVNIVPKTDRPGIDVYIAPNVQDETVYIPSCVTKGGIDDVVFNDFHVGENAKVLIITGCSVNTDDSLEAKHSGVHRFFIEKGAHVNYEERHVGFGEGDGKRTINPSTTIELAEGSYLEINSTQISGVDVSLRSTNATVGKDAKLIIHERLFTEKEQNVKTVYRVELNGDGSNADIVSRSVARDHSYQSTDSTIVGNAACTGHSECDAIIGEEAIVDASPRLFAHNKDAEMIHEAAIGKIAGEQILKLQTLGLSEEEAENEIVQGFLA